MFSMKKVATSRGDVREMRWRVALALVLSCGGERVSE